MKNKKIIIRIVLSIVVVLLVVLAFVAGQFSAGGAGAYLPPVDAVIDQNPADYGEEELAVLDASEQFWTAMEQADEEGMRAVADPNCTFVHIGMTCKLDEEVGFYTSGMFQPTEIVFHGQSVDRYEDTAIVITDCDYTLDLGGMETSHHFAVTEVYVNRGGGWNLIQFSFTALNS